MGRKKRKVADAAGVPEVDADAVVPLPLPLPPPPPPPPPPTLADPRSKAKPATIKAEPAADATINAKDGEKEAVKASHYAMTSHSGEIVGAEVYVSSGSEDEEDDVEIVLSGSKMGLMRRGLQHQTLVQPNLRQWVKPEATEGDEAADETEEQQRLKEEEELAKLDPAERAARLLVEKQRKLEEAKENARRLESEENAGRDPCLFSKRTAFDIRFDQIDDKPWERGAGDVTDFFNYGLTVEDWLEYAELQLSIRQELTDASRQKRPPDPNIVPVTGKKPKSQTPKVAVAGVEEDDVGNVKIEDEAMEDTTDAPVIGPALVKKEKADDNESADAMDTSDDDANKDVYVGSGGAWGAGAAPDSMLARLIAEQTQPKPGGTTGGSVVGAPETTHSQPRNNDHYGGNRSGDNSYENPGHYGAPSQYDAPSQYGAPSQYAPLPGQYGAPTESYDNRGSSGYGGRGGGGRFNSYGGGRGGGDYHSREVQGGGYGDSASYGGNSYEGGGERFDSYNSRGRGRGRGRGGRGGGRFNSYGRGGGRGDHYGGGGGGNRY